MKSWKIKIWSLEICLLKSTVNGKIFIYVLSRKKKWRWNKSKKKKSFINQWRTLRVEKSSISKFRMLKKCNAFGQAVNKRLLHNAILEYLWKIDSIKEINASIFYATLHIGYIFICVKKYNTFAGKKFFVRWSNKYIDVK